MTQGHITLTLKWNYTQRTWDLSTFDKEAPYKTHLRTNYFQALTNKLQAVDKGRFQKRFSGFWPLRGGGYPPCPLSFFDHNDCPLRGGFSGRWKKDLLTYFSPFTSSHFHISNSRPGKWQIERLTTDNSDFFLDTLMGFQRKEHILSFFLSDFPTFSLLCHSVEGYGTFTDE